MRRRWSIPVTIVVNYTVRSRGSSPEKRSLRHRSRFLLGHILLFVVSVVFVDDLFPETCAFAVSLTLQLSPIQDIEAVLVQDQTFHVSAESGKPLASQRGFRQRRRRRAGVTDVDSVSPPPPPRDDAQLDEEEEYGCCK